MKTLTYSAALIRQAVGLRSFQRFTVLALLSLVATNILAQTGEKFVSLEARKSPSEVVKFSNLKINGSEQAFDKNFRAENGWIERVAFQIENLSEKEIVAMHISLHFPETKEDGPPYFFTFIVGNQPNVGPQTNKPLGLAKGQKVGVDLASHYDQLTRFIANNRSIDRISRVDLEPSFVFFSDGSAFRLGTFVRRDPKHPERWVSMHKLEQRVQ